MREIVAAAMTMRGAGFGLCSSLAACGGAVSTAPCDADAAALCANPSLGGQDASLAEAPDGPSASTDGGTDARPDAQEGVDAASGAGATTPCLGGRSVLYLAGPNFSQATDLAVSDSVRGQGDPENIYIAASNGSGPFQVTYNAAFSTARLAEPMTTQLYSNAQRTPFEENGHAGLEVSGNGRGCNTIEGSFRVDALAWDAEGRLILFTAAFEQFCDGAPDPIRGCVHFRR